MTIAPPPASTVNTNVPPQNYNGVPPKQEQVGKFNEALNRSTTSNDASGTQSSKGTDQSQGTSNSYQLPLATRPPLNLAKPAQPYAGETPKGPELETSDFRLALEESELSGPAPGTHLNPTASGKALFGGLPQSQFFYADANGAGGTGTGVHHGQASSGSIGGSKAPALRLGSTGPAVRTLQQELNKWRAEQWPKQPPIAADGRFTRETKSAVEDFQKANQIRTGTLKLDLTPNGIADVRVQNRLRLENDPAF
jgi:hypothetical protein